MAQPSALDACLEIAAEMRAVANDPAANLTPADRRALMILAVEVERTVGNSEVEPVADEAIAPIKIMNRDHPPHR